MSIEAETLAKQAAQGDAQAFTAIFDRYYAAVLNYIHYRCDEPTAEDLTEVVFERLMSALPKYDPDRASISSFLFGIAHHVVTDWLRHESLRAWLPWEAFLRRPAADPLPEAVVQQHELYQQLEAALAHLSPRERDVLGLKFSARLTNRQIAALMGLGENQVAVVLYRAVGRLRRRIPEESQPNPRPVLEVENE